MYRIGEKRPEKDCITLSYASSQRRGDAFGKEEHSRKRKFNRIHRVRQEKLLDSCRLKSGIGKV